MNNPMQSAGGGGAMTGPKGEVRSPMTVTILTVVTCGIYWLYLFYFKVLPELKAYTGKSDEELNPTKELIIGLICSPYQFLTLMKTGKIIQEAQLKAGRQGAEDKGTMFLIMALVFFLAVPFMIQTELNKIWDPSAT